MCSGSGVIAATDALLALQPDRYALCWVIMKLTLLCSHLFLWEPDQIFTSSSVAILAQVAFFGQYISMSPTNYDAQIFTVG